MFLSIVFFQESSLFLTEFIFKWPKINLFREQLFISFSPIFHSTILLPEPYSQKLLNCFQNHWNIIELLQSYGGVSYCRCVKSTHIWSYYDPYFLAFGGNTGRYGVFDPNSGKYGPEMSHKKAMWGKLTLSQRAKSIEKIFRKDKY